MAEITGRETEIGFKKATTWGTAVTIASGDGLFITSDGVMSGHAFEILRDMALGKPWVQDTDKGLETISGDITMDLRYQGQELLIALAMGDPQTKAGTGPYTMTILLEPTLRGLFATYAYLIESATVVEVPSLKVHGFSLAADYGNPVVLTANCTGNRMFITGDTNITNTDSDLAAIAIDNDIKQNRVIFDDGADFLLNLEAGAALSSPTDRIGIGSFNFTFDRPIDTFPTVAAALLGTGIQEPIDSDFPNPQFTITKPEVDGTDSVSFIRNMRIGTTYKASLTFAKGTDYEFNLYMPRMRVSATSPAVVGPGRIPHEITFDLLQATAAPTGMTSALPFYITTKNNETTAPF